MKKTTWILIILLLGVGTYIGANYSRELLPGLYFNYDSNYGPFAVHSDQPINRGVSFILKEVTTHLQATQLYSEDEKFSIFLCYNREKYGRFAREVGQPSHSQGLTVEPMGYVFINLREIGTIGQRYGDRYQYSLLSGSATHILVHELTHVLLTEKLGMFDSPDLPTWKREGYAEYAASKYNKRQDSTYSFREQVKTFLSDEYEKVDPGRLQYIRYELLVEYLLDVKQLQLSALLNRSFEPDQVFNELKQWAQATAGE